MDEFTYISETQLPKHEYIGKHNIQHKHWGLKHPFHPFLPFTIPRTIGQDLSRQPTGSGMGLMSPLPLLTRNGARGNKQGNSPEELKNRRSGGERWKNGISENAFSFPCCRYSS